MCKQPTTTLSRVLATIANLGPEARARVRTLLGPAPPPSLRDVLQQSRGTAPNDRERLTAALSSGRSEIAPAPSTPRAATVAFKGGK